MPTLTFNGIGNDKRLPGETISAMPASSGLHAAGTAPQTGITRLGRDSGAPFSLRPLSNFKYGDFLNQTKHDIAVAGAEAEVLGRAGS